jgi:GTPase
MDLKKLENWETFSQLINKSEFIKLSYLNSLPKQPNEVEVGNREYKIHLNFLKLRRKKNLKGVLNKKATQMNYRLIEGAGMAVYFLGVADNGNTNGISILDLIISLLYFSEIVNLSNSHFKKIRIYPGSTGYIATIRVYKKIENISLFLEL